jgi:mannose/fructose/N-acetylgalactosamine-specific phosphotransferase system component IIC
MSPADLVIVALLGGALSLDAVSVAQTMISRPIVASTLVGMLFGSPESGLVVGAVLEMLAMETMPFGASRYLEWSCGAVVGSLFVVSSGGITGRVLLVGVVFALLSSWLAGSSMIVMRRVNGQLVAARRAALESGQASVLPMLQFGGIALDFVRGALVATVGSLLSLSLGRALVYGIGVVDQLTMAVVVAVPAAVALAASFRIFATGSRHAYLLLAGTLLGAALVASQ